MVKQRQHHRQRHVLVSFSRFVSFFAILQPHFSSSMSYENLILIMRTSPTHTHSYTDIKRAGEGVRERHASSRKQWESQRQRRRRQRACVWRSAASRRQWQCVRQRRDNDVDCAVSVLHACNICCYYALRTSKLLKRGILTLCKCIYVIILRILKIQYYDLNLFLVDLISILIR